MLFSCIISKYAPEALVAGSTISDPTFDRFLLKSFRCNAVYKKTFAFSTEGFKLPYFCIKKASVKENQTNPTTFMNYQDLQMFTMKV